MYYLRVAKVIANNSTSDRINEEALSGHSNGLA
jgi:hypothetical protein